MMKPRIVQRSGMVAILAGTLMLPAMLAACDQQTSTQKTTETKTVDTPEGKKKVTETHEKTTTTDPK